MLSVLLDTRERHYEQNPYIFDLTQQSAEVEYIPFSWRTLIFGRYDIFHVHWPEWLVVHRNSAAQIAIRILFALGFLALRARSKTVVRTVHNLEPHNGSSASVRRAIARLDSITTARIWLNELDRENMGPRDSVIGHPDYRPWMERIGHTPSDPPGQSRALCLGSLTRYRNFEEVIAGVGELSKAELKIAGAATDAVYQRELEIQAHNQQARIEITGHRLSDPELAKLVNDADVVFVPYTNLYNSGIIFLALTLERPVALKSGNYADALVREFGSDWIRVWDGNLDHQQASQILNHSQPTFGATSRARNWQSVAAAHARFYEKALEVGN
ncbi:hypothetical protein [Demequina silvatica]|uniref:hypothetical protein n=1 Tax=Demequina silvatica TaxID=1638988 RepID=UPI000AC5959B|nr:hypothetical protein [Demequina silvatica]